jgi:hypothetical protein
MMTKESVSWMVGLAVVVSVAAYGYNLKQRGQNLEEVVKMTSKMKTLCVGRFLIDLPADAHYEFGSAFMGGFRVSGTEESRVRFEARMAAREAELQSETDDQGRRSLESVKAIDRNGFTGKVFIYGRTSSYTLGGGVRRDWVAVKLDGFVHAGSKGFRVIADRYDPARIGNVDKLVDQLQALPADVIPTAPGLCFGAGMLLDPIRADQAEKAMLFVGLPGHPDIRIAFNTMAGLKRTWPTLLERRAQLNAEQPLWERQHFSTLRSGPRIVNGLAGEEAVMKVTELNFSVIYGLDWELPGTQDNVLEPAIHLEMSTGNNPKSGGAPVQSTLGQQAVLDLWDKMVSSIRVRPTAPPASAYSPEPAAGPSLGAEATAGEPCPESGWWTCADGGAGVRVYGGAHQYLRKGQRMPQALLLPPQTLWEKVRRVQPSYESNTLTVWKLTDRRARARAAPAVALDQPKHAISTTLPPAGTSVASQFAVGANAATGAPCPASGWWRCEEVNALDGTRWFAEGSLLPAATFVLPGGAGKAAGVIKAIHRRGAWRLVRLAQAPTPVIEARDMDDPSSVPPMKG